MGMRQDMMISRRGNRGFTLTEVLFAGIVTVLVITTIMSIWIFSHETWMAEGKRTGFRIDVMKAIETIKNDIRLSSATYMSFYPEGGDPYTAMSMPLAAIDAQGYHTMDDNDMVAWDKTVFYHIVENEQGANLVRTVIDSWDDDLDKDGRYDLLADVATGAVTGDYSTAMIKDYLEYFEISSSAPVIDFYDDSSDPVKKRNIVFGYAYIGSGDHTVRFTVTGKNDASSGYALGLDNLHIDPAGYPREAEYYDSTYAPSGSIVSSGALITVHEDSVWDNNNYLEYGSTGEYDYIEFKDYYDLVRESCFENSILSNMIVSGDDVRVKLETPDDRAEGETRSSWSSYSQTQDSNREGQDGDLPGYPIVIRSIIKNEGIEDTDLIRLLISAPPGNPVKIDSVYLSRKELPADDTNRLVDPDGLSNQSTSGLEIEEYHRHQQLFFTDVYDGDGDGDSSEIMPEVWIPPGEVIWSEWIAFPMVQMLDGDTDDLDYLVTMSIPDLESVVFRTSGEWSAFDSGENDCLYWEGSDTNSFLHNGSYTTAGTASWTGLPLSLTLNVGAYTTDNDKFTPDNNVYYITEIDTWSNTGSVKSTTYDTEMSDPVYNEAKWSQPSSSGTEVRVKARSSDNQDMNDASDWDSITGTTSNPGSLSMSDGRYFQFMIEITSDIVWKNSSSTVSYKDYVDEQVSMDDWEFPERSSLPLVSGYYSTWIDDVEIDWPGRDRICVFKGDIAKKNDYGQAKITIDGEELVKVLKVELSLSAEFQGRTIRETNVLEIEPRNTGR